MKKMQFMTRGLLLVSLCLLYSTSPVQADEWLDTEDLYKHQSHRDSCPRLSGRGEIVYESGRSLRKQSATIEFTQWDEIAVTIAGTRQKADRVRMRDVGKGRYLVTLLFKRPEVLGGKGAALLSGTVFHRGSDAMFYGNVYFNAESPYEDICDSKSWYDNAIFDWDYLGKFEFRNF